MIPAAEQERRRCAALHLTHERTDYRKTPLPATALYAALRAHARNVCGTHLIMHTPHIAETRALAVSEYPFVLALATALRIMTLHAPNDEIHVKMDEEGKLLILEIEVSPRNPRVLQQALQEAETSLSSLASSSHFESALILSDRQLTYRLSAPYYDINTFEIYACNSLAATIAELAFAEVWDITLL